MREERVPVFAGKSQQLSAESTRLALLERERELAAIDRAFDRLSEGIGSLLIVEGPAGIGKSSIITAAAERARARTLTIRGARGGEFEREMPFGISRQLLERVVEKAAAKERARILTGSAELALIAFGRRQPDHVLTEDTFAPIHGLYWLVANLAESQPLVLLVDDAHWGDRQSLHWLHYLARRLVDMPVLVVLAARSGEPDEPWELEALRLEAQQVLRPAPLTGAAVQKLIAVELEREPSPGFTEACRKVTRGNPFLLAEVLRALRADSIKPTEEAVRAIAELGPDSVARYVLMRLARFGEEGIELARAIAVLGGSPQLRHAAALARLEDARAAELCDRLREADVLTVGLPIGFVHPLVRAAIYRDLSEEERNMRHRQAAELLRSTGANAADAAPHLLACSPNGDQWVVEQLREAAREARRAAAPHAAQAYLERALEEPPEDELPVLGALGRSLIGTDAQRAVEVLRDVTERAPDEDSRFRGLLALALARVLAGRTAEAARSYRQLLAFVPKRAHEQRLQLEAMAFCLERLAVSRDAASARRIEALVADGGSSSDGEIVIRQALGLDRLFACEPVEEVVELLTRFPRGPRRTFLLMPIVAAQVLPCCGRFDIARRAMETAIEADREAGLLAGVGSGFASLALIDRLAGRLRAAEAHARTAREVAAGLGPGSPPVSVATMNLIATLIEREELEEAAQLAGPLDLSDATPSGSASIATPREIRAYLRVASGDLAGAADDLLAVGEAVERMEILNPALIPWRQQAAPILVSLDRTREAEELIAVAEERARRFGSPHLIGTVLRARASLEPRARQVETLRESVAALERYGPPHELARSLLDLGSTLRRDGRRSDSREPLRAALEFGYRAGVSGIERRAREELAAAGSRPRSPVRTGVDSLTFSERRVARLAAEGLSNTEIAQRLFITAKTVEKHLRNTYSKLEIGGRRELPGSLSEGDSQKK